MSENNTGLDAGSIYYKCRGLVDEHHFDANMDPDPVLYFNADPDPALYLNADPDQAFQFNEDPDPASENNAKSSADPDPQQHRFQFANRLRLVTSWTCLVRS